MTDVIVPCAGASNHALGTDFRSPINKFSLACAVVHDAILALRTTFLSLKLNYPGASS